MKNFIYIFNLYSIPRPTDFAELKYFPVGMTAKKGYSPPPTILKI